MIKIKKLNTKITFFFIKYLGNDYLKEMVGQILAFD